MRYICLFISMVFAVFDGASESAPVIRSGHFAEITDSGAGQYTIESFRMSGDGSRVAFYVRQTVVDARSCYAYQLRVIDADGTNEILVEQGFTYDTGVGNSCANGLYDAYDISDDGGTIAYIRLRGPGDLAPEIVAYDVNTATKTSLLQTLSYRAYGETTQRDIDPYGGRALFTMTGDGAQVYFVNSFGPYGSPGSTGEPGPSGFSVYRVMTDGSGTEAIYTSAGLATTPGVSTSATYVSASGGRLAVDFDGSLLLLPVGGNFPSANPPIHILKIDPDAGAASAEVYLDFAGLGLSGPAVSADGATATFARTGSATPEMNGLFARGTGPDAQEIRLDAHLVWTANPDISTDGTVVVYNVDQGGGSSPALRYATADGALLIPLTEPIVRTRFNYGAVSTDGGRVIFCGAVEGASAFAAIAEYNLVRLDWNGTGSPQIESVTAEPELTLLLQSIFDHEKGLNTQFYAVSGSNLAGAYSYPFNSDARIPEGTGEFHIHGGILDDGAFDGDAVAGDGIFTENGLYVSSEQAEAPLKLRVGVTTTVGTAGFVDVEIPLRADVPATANFVASSLVGTAPLAVTFEDVSTGDYLDARWDFDGNYTTDLMGVAGQTVNHTYESAGNFDPWLEVTGRGSTNQLRDHVTIRVFADSGEMAVTLADEMVTADADLSGGLDLDEAHMVVPGLNEDTFDAWDNNGDEALSRRELLEGAGGAGTVHTGDQDADLRIQLNELLRLIQFFNSGGMHCADSPDATEDGYAPGPGGQSCTPHGSDYNPQDWVVDLQELLRAIQFYNTGGYTPCPEESTEDGYCPGRE